MILYKPLIPVVFISFLAFQQVICEDDGLAEESVLAAVEQLEVNGHNDQPPNNTEIMDEKIFEEMHNREENISTPPMLSIIDKNFVNLTVSNETIANTTTLKKFACLLDQEYGEPAPTPIFNIVNGTTLLSTLKQNQNVTSRTQPAVCQLVLFYAPWCPFSVQAAPHLNALPRGFPMLSFLAIDAHLHNSLSTVQGVMAIPSLFLFHNGKAAARYNETEYKIDLFAAFITRYTGISPIGIMNRTSADYQGPLPTSVVETTDPWLILAWVVFFLSILYWFTRSNLFWTLIENVRNTWREAEAQHLHVD